MSIGISVRPRRKARAFAAAVEVCNAAAAQERVRGIGANVRSPVPAPLAFVAAARIDGNRERARRLRRARARAADVISDEAQVVAEARPARRNRRRARRSSLPPAATSRSRPSWRSDFELLQHRARARRECAATSPTAPRASGTVGKASPHVWTEDRRIVRMHDPPRFLGGEREDRRHQPEKRVADARGAPSAPTGARWLSRAAV